MSTVTGVAAESIRQSHYLQQGLDNGAIHGLFATVAPAVGFAPSLELAIAAGRAYETPYIKGSAG